jgi:hypothetical protein
MTYYELMRKLLELSEDQLSKEAEIYDAATGNWLTVHDIGLGGDGHLTSDYEAEWHIGQGEPYLFTGNMVNGKHVIEWHEVEQDTRICFCLEFSEKPDVEDCRLVQWKRGNDPAVYGFHNFRLSRAGFGPWVAEWYCNKTCIHDEVAA